MRILLVNDYSELVGGTEMYLNTLISELAKQGHIVETYYGSDNYQNSLKNRTKLTNYINRIFNFKHYFEFRKKIKKFKPDVIHFQNIFNEVTPSVVLAARNIPKVMTIHDYQIVQAVFDVEVRTGKKCKNEVCPGCLHCVGLKGTIFETIKRSIHRPILKSINFLIAPSEWCKSILDKSGENYTVKQIYNGLTLYNAYPIHGKPIALYSGRLTEEKGVQYFIDSIPEILKVIPNFKVNIAGDGGLKKELETKINNLKIKSVVKLKGYLNKKQLEKQYEICSVVIVPSIWAENLPTVCIEALSSGRPVVASNIGGIPEMISNGKNGFLVKSKNSSEISQKVIKILDDKTLLSKLSQTAHDSTEKFNLENHINKLLEIYTQLAVA